MCYIISMNIPRSWYVALNAMGGSQGGERVRPNNSLADPSLGVEPRTVVEPTHGFEHDGFFPWYFVDMVKGTNLCSNSGLMDWGL